MITIFIERNIAQALEYINSIKDSKSLQVFFLLDPKARGPRKENEMNNFNFLKSEVPSIQIVAPLDLDQYKTEDNYYFGNNAFDEQKITSNISAHLGLQNRMFDHLDTKDLKSFTPFRKKVEEQLPNRYIDNIYQPSDQFVLSELSYYFEETHLAKKYFEIRNGALGRDYSTKFSVHLASGRLNVRFLYNYLKDYEEKYGANKSTYWIQFELLWREFFYWSYQKYGKRYFSKNGIHGSEDYNRNIKGPGYRALFKSDPFMTSVLNELTHSGFISNRFRQVFASSLINKYKIDWRLGAILFEHYLIDYDVYSNWGNWQYLAGVGHDPRGLRLFNVTKQLNDHDPECEYIKHWSDWSDVKKIRMELDIIYPQM